MAPKIAVFPKAFMDALCVEGSMSLSQWIASAAHLGVDGLEFYGGFLDLRDPGQWSAYRRMVEDVGLSIPMLCCSPDFCQADAAARQREVERHRRWIDMTVALGGRYCRVLSGQVRPEISRYDGLAYVTESIHECLAYAAGAGVTLTLENHYKDNYWKYPEFAQRLDVFMELLGRIEHPFFGVNFDPSNALLAGDDALTWLRCVRDRVVTMHASDRYIVEGSLDDVRRMETAEGYAACLEHGEIGCGLLDYDAIFGELRRMDFSGWISVEDGVGGVEQLHRSVQFLHKKIDETWPALPQ